MAFVVENRIQIGCKSPPDKKKEGLLRLHPAAGFVEAPETRLHLMRPRARAPRSRRRDQDRSAGAYPETPTLSPSDLQVAGIQPLTGREPSFSSAGRTSPSGVEGPRGRDGRQRSSTGRQHGGESSSRSQTPPPLRARHRPCRSTIAAGRVSDPMCIGCGIAFAHVESLEVRGTGAAAASLPHSSGSPRTIEELLATVQYSLPRTGR